MLSRRKFLSSTAAIGALGTINSLTPLWARFALANQVLGAGTLSGTEFQLTIDKTDVYINGKRGDGITINGQLPAPLLRMREGDDVTIHVTNNLDEDSSIHWHGLLLPFQMDGVPGVSFPGIKPKETFTYKFPVKQAGTYWYHSHSGLQEQSGLYGPIIIEPKAPDPVQYDREYIVMLSDWTFQNPHSLFNKLMQKSESLNYQQRTVGDFFNDVEKNGLGKTISDRLMWGKMRMNPTDISDITSENYKYLINGQGIVDNWQALFNIGERVRLRLINASAMTIFNFRIPDLPFTVVQADGLNVQPLESDELQIGLAETYDIIVEPKVEKAYTMMAESIDRSGFARATLAPHLNVEGDIPPLRQPPKLTMKDMGMAHDETSAMPDNMSAHSMHSAHSMEPTKPTMQQHNHPLGAGVANTPAMPMNRLNEPGLGLENVPHRTLTYTDLKSLEPNPDHREPSREIELHLTGNMERYMWSFDGVQFSHVSEPIIFNKGERLRLTLVNDTMMNHPIHLHGMFFDVVNGSHMHKPRKHTIIVKPSEKLSLDITADALGDWAFHCHMLYHMHAGMMQVVSVRDGDEVVSS